MIKLGEIQSLKISRMASVGAYLFSEDYPKEEILLPLSQVPREKNPGDNIDVFVYRDSKDRLIATVRRPLLTLGQTGELKVSEVSDIGAFLDWGLEKDLLLPFKEQACRVIKGNSYLVGVYIDNSDRLCATMNVYKMLKSNSPYSAGDKVEGKIYLIKKDMGAFVAVDNQYHGLIALNELYGKYQCGDRIEARVVKVRDDGKLDLSLREKAYKQMDSDAKIILKELIENNGILYLNDDSSPEIINKRLNMSKRAFKRAVGRLLKEDMILFTENGIKLKSNGD
ncbi:MAG: S1 RNA-binding domain-containing protein [Clostridiales bacterium]|nr:S1 RNA-binding domain-containing protein [Clostridiales bacterium]